jgi:hypothetical protein
MEPRSTACFRAAPRRSPVQRFVGVWVGFWVMTPIRILERLGLVRVRSRHAPRAGALRPNDEDEGNAAAGVGARLPTIPPHLSAGNALTIPRPPIDVDARS